MSTPTTFRTLTADELEQRAATEAELALDSLRPEIIEDDPEHPGADPLAKLLSVALPYSLYARVYRRHVDGCPACQNSPVWDIECPLGNALASRAADACAAQSLSAVRN